MGKTPKKNFTAAQQAAIDLMNDGWELGVSVDHTRPGGRTRYWLQEGKIGFGGKTQKITAGTFNSLKEAAVIRQVSRGLGPYSGIFELDREHLATLGQPSVPDGA